MDAVRTLLESQPLLTLFVTIALGYVIGECSIKGVALGSGAVLFVGLAIGGFAPKSAPPAVLGTLGLLLFLYGIGVQYGARFIAGLSSADGLKANAAAVLGVIGAGFVSLALGPLFGVKLDQALGLYAGAGTSTASLQAVLAVLKGEGAAVGYSVAYPFGVAGPILFLYLLSVALARKIEAPPAHIMETAEIALRNQAFVGLTFPELKARLPAGLGIAAVRRAHHNQLPADDFVMQTDDVLLATSMDGDELRKATELLGELHPGRMTRFREDLDYLRVFASSRTVVGHALRDIRFPDGMVCSIAHVRRGDADMLPSPDLILEFGDRVGLLIGPGQRDAVRKLFGDSIKGTAELSYISIGIGAALGLLVGLIPLPIPGVGKFVARARRAAAGRALSRQDPASGWTCLDYAAFGESRAAQLRPDGVSRAGRAVVGTKVLCDDRPHGHLVPAVRRGHSDCARVHHGGVLPVAFSPAVRRDRRRDQRRDGQPCDPRVREPHRADRSPRYRLRDDLSIDDDRENSVRRDRGGGLGRINRFAVHVLLI